MYIEVVVIYIYIPIFRTQRHTRIHIYMSTERFIVKQYANTNYQGFIQGCDRAVSEHRRHGIGIVYILLFNLIKLSAFTMKGL